MAKIKLGSLVTEITGKIGGHQFSNSPTGTILANSPSQLKKNSYNLSSNLAVTTTVKQAWRSLSQATRNTWCDWAQVNVYDTSAFAITNPFKPSVLTSSYLQRGYQLFIQYNVLRLNYGLSILTVPASTPHHIPPISVTVGTPSTEIQFNLSRSYTGTKEFFVASISAPLPSFRLNPGKSFIRQNLEYNNLTLISIGVDELRKYNNLFDIVGYTHVNFTVVHKLVPIAQKLIVNQRIQIPN